MPKPRLKRNETKRMSGAAIAGQADDAVRLLVEHYTRTSALVATQARRRSLPGLNTG